MEKLAEVCKASDGLLLETTYRQVDVTDTASFEEATQVVGRADQTRWRRHVRKAAGLYCARTTRVDPSRGQMPRP